MSNSYHSANNRRNAILAVLSAVLCFAVLFSMMLLEKKSGAAETTVTRETAVVYDISEITDADSFEPAGNGQMIGSFPGGETVNAAVRMKVAMPVCESFLWELQILGNDAWMNAGNAGYTLFVNDSYVEIHTYEGTWPTAGGGSTVATPEVMKSGGSYVLEFGAVREMSGDVWVGNYVYVKVNGEFLTTRSCSAEGTNDGGAQYSFKNGGANLYVGQTPTGTIGAGGIRFETALTTNTAAVYDIHDLTNKWEVRPQGLADLIGSFPEGTESDAALIMNVVMPETMAPWSIQILGSDGWMGANSAGYTLFVNNEYLEIQTYEGTWPPSGGGSSVATPESMKAGKTFLLEFGVAKKMNGENWIGNYVYVKVNGDLIASRTCTAEGENFGFKRVGRNIYMGQDLGGVTADYLKQLTFKTSVTDDSSIAEIAAVQQGMDAIPTTITPENAGDIAALRVLYDALAAKKDTRGNPLTAYIAYPDRLPAAEQFIADATAAAAPAVQAISGLPEAENVSLGDESAINAARSAYNAVPEQYRSFVTNYAKLTAVLEKYIEISGGYVADIIARIDSLPSVEEITLENEAEIAAIQEDYDNLPANLQSEITNYTKLTEAAERIAALHTAQDDAAAVNGALDALPATERMRLTHEAAVKAVREQYDALSETAKGFVDMDKLTAAEGRIAALKALMLPDNQDTAEVFDIREITGSWIFDPQGAAHDMGAFPGGKTINAAVKMNVMIPETQGTWSIQVLGADGWMGTASAGFTLLITPEYLEIQVYEGFWEPDGDTSRVALPDSMKGGKTFLLEFGAVKCYENDVWAANYAYVKVNGTQIAQRLNTIEGSNDGGAPFSFKNTGSRFYMGQNVDAAYIGELRFATSAIGADTIKEILDVQSGIDSIPLTITPETAAELSALREKFDALAEKKDLNGEALSTYLTETNKLVQAEEFVSAATAAAAPVVEAIDALPTEDELAMADGADLAAAQAAYAALSEEYKVFVTNYADLTVLLEKFDEIAQTYVADLIDRIDALPAKAELTLEDESDVAALIEEYENLPENIRSQVENSAKLTEAAERIGELRSQENAKEVIAMIEAIPSLNEITLEDEAAIAAAREAYNNLTQEEKAFVNAGKLAEAEERIAALKEIPEDQNPDPDAPGDNDGDADGDTEDDGGCKSEIGDVSLWVFIVASAAFLSVTFMRRKSR